MKPYADLGSDLELPWAQSKSATLTSFINGDILLVAFRQKLSKQKK